jgi:hypothetical protein
VLDTHAYPVDDSTPRIERLRFSHITARNAQFAAGVFHGLPEMPLRDIVLHDVDIQMNPDAREGETAMASSIPRMSKRAFFCRYVSGLYLQSVRVEGYEGPFVDAENCEEVHVDSLSTEQGAEDDTVNRAPSGGRPLEKI